MKKLIFIGCLLLASNSFASKIESDVINVDADFKAREVQNDKLKKLRAKLEKQNEMMMMKKIETMRYQQEMKLMKQMQQMFAENQNELNNLEIE